MSGGLAVSTLSGMMDQYRRCVLVSQVATWFYQPTHSHSVSTFSWKRHKSMVNVAGMRYLRNVCGKTLMDRVSDEWLLKDFSLKGNTIVQCERNVLRWFGHAEKMSVEGSMGVAELNMRSHMRSGAFSSRGGEAHRPHSAQSGAARL
uniref:Uncharacterized protein n=1 Tax=Timema bartmani TaxID=61472 RepID=A0A7R9FBT0_9NEOP|nr:unnamed protein product [Timema bartmani]